MKALLVSLLVCAGLPAEPQPLEFEPGQPETPAAELGEPEAGAAEGMSPLLTLNALEASAPRVFERVRLQDLRHTPSRFAGRAVRCAVQIASVDLPFDSFFSRFDPTHDLCFSAWDDDQRVWHSDQFNDPARGLFIERESALGQRIASARPHQRFLLTLRVREIWAGEPWIEVEGAVEIQPSAGEGTILHASRAQSLWGTGQRELAIGELERALASPLPNSLHLALDEELEFMREQFALNPTPTKRPPPAGQETVYRLNLR